jgi:hypothetical protein
MRKLRRGPADGGVVLKIEDINQSSQGPDGSKAILFVDNGGTFTGKGRGVDFRPPCDPGPAVVKKSTAGCVSVEASRPKYFGPVFSFFFFDRSHEVV